MPPRRSSSSSSVCLRHQPADLQLEQHRADRQEPGRLLEVPAARRPSRGRGSASVTVGDRHVAHVDLLLQDQLGEQTERTGEDRAARPRSCRCGARDRRRSLAHAKCIAVAHGRQRLGCTTGRTSVRARGEHLRDADPASRRAPRAAPGTARSCSIRRSARFVLQSTHPSSPVRQCSSVHSTMSGENLRCSANIGTDLRAAGVAAAQLLRIGDERADLRADRVGLVVEIRSRCRGTSTSSGRRSPGSAASSDSSACGSSSTSPYSRLNRRTISRRDLEVRDLVLAHRHERPAHDRDVDRLQHAGSRADPKFAMSRSAMSRSRSL